jgi:tetratricopeptide (TPR) repeat protein
MQSYLKVKEIYDFLFGNTDSRVALTLNKIGLAELARGDFDMAMNYLQEALRVQRINFRNLAPNEINPDASQTLVNIGSVYYKERNSFDKIQWRHDDYKSFIESDMLGKIAFAHSERGEHVKFVK